MLPRGRSRDSFSTGCTRESATRTPYRLSQTHLGTRNAEETHRHEHAGDRDLVVSKLDAVEILYTQTVRCDETIKRKNLVHLNCCNQCTATLADDVSYYELGLAVWTVV